MDMLGSTAEIIKVLGGICPCHGMIIRYMKL